MTAQLRVWCLVFLIPLQALASPPPGGDVLEEFDIGQDAGPVVVPVTIEGKSYPFVVDTGSSQSVFDASLRPLLGKAVETRTVLTPVGPKQLTYATSPAVCVGRLPFRKGATVAVHDLRPLREASGLDVKGVLGMDFLSQHIIRIDFDRGRLTVLRSPGHDAGHRLPLRTVRGTPAVEADPTGAGAPVWFLVDTADVGSASGRLEEGLFRLLKGLGKLTPAGLSKVETAGGSMEVQQGRLGCLKIGPFTHRGLCFGTTRDVEALGLTFWARYTVTFDFPAGVAYLRAGARHAAPDAPGGSGLGMVRREGRTVVEGVRDGSPAARAGLRKGDEVMSIDGKKAGDVSLIVLGRLLCGEGRTVQVVIRRGGQVHEVSLRLELACRTAKTGQ